MLLRKSTIPVTLYFSGGFNEVPYEERQYGIYNMYGFICGCQACTEDWPEPSKELPTTTAEMLNNCYQWTSDKRVKYKLMCERMSQLPGARDKTYQLIYTMFRQLLSVYQYGFSRRRFPGLATKLQSSGMENMCAMKHCLFER